MIEPAPQEDAGLGAGAAPPGATAGAMLRAAREAAGLHVAALAVAMKVPVAKLEALEQDRYDLLPDAVFARALASTICRTLKVDPAPVLARLPQSGAPRLVQDNEGINTPFRSPRDAVAQPWKEQLTRPVSLVVGALLLGMVAVLLWPRPSADDGAPVAAPSAPAPEGAGAPGASAAAAGAQAPVLAAAVTPAPDAMPASVNPAGPQAAPAAPAPAAASAPAPAAPAGAPAGSASSPAPSGVVVFRTSGESWVEVRDATGATPVRKLMTAGETAAASGAMPLRVIVGNAGATEVQVRGQPYDLRPIARDNVARFEVK